MPEVQAVKDHDTVKLISFLLEKQFSQQLADVWNIGLNLALRISDLLSIKFDDIQDDRLIIRESKTGKLANIKLNSTTLERIARIRQEHPNHIYLFQSYRNQRSKTVKPAPLSRRYVCRALAMVGEEIKLALGTHSMRKTRGYHLYQNTKDIGRVMKMLRHSSEGVTLRYIGIEQDDVDQDFQELEL
ncbi:site-specific integrase [Shewanella colwelliana]|uniref:tyrosine-type recombinase/integrase n=1 Tax=Shewanella TaxID=22 RepID=UPI001BC68C08|nr:MULTISPECIES: tyrosine-type recombinase/integrase [Shewanella]MCG9748243.1 tyrosine-type recombinase/integrase [Shewanella sp. Isolate8]QYK01733.1 tyrosine-type recombinase/integrase [Shewanella psychrotolerans]GIU33635.1 site-specific integrase [Shewanella colwelliana]